MLFFDKFLEYIKFKSIFFVSLFSIIIISLLYLFDDSMNGDMIMFITPAIHFLKYGSFSELINWPSGNMMPVLEPYTDFFSWYHFFVVAFSIYF